MINYLGRRKIHHADYTSAKINSVNIFVLIFLVRISYAKHQLQKRRVTFYDCPVGRFYAEKMDARRIFDEVVASCSAGNVAIPEVECDQSLEVILSICKIFTQLVRQLLLQESISGEATTRREPPPSENQK